ncbi:MAG TPA: MBL fold metallo-hydrolase [Rhodanobacteraceae bacterium]|nr:MBL fold metallo-hydrolase [Rhodanobacteraceae bacterium]
MRMRRMIGFMVLAVAAGVLCGPASAAPAAHSEQPTVTAKQVAPHVWYLHAAGGNQVALLGKDGTLLVDASFKPFVPAILARLKSIGASAPKFVIDTHYHSDHTDGNGALRAAGATVIAHDRVRDGLTRVQRPAFGEKRPLPVPAGDLPDITYARQLTLHLDGETVRVVHLPPGHTDGDSVVVFEQANVIATGDLFFNGMYPYIDVNAGGSVGGSIDDIDRLLEMMDDETVVIPGHGAVADKATLKRYRDMLASMRDSVRKLINDGKTLDEIQAMRPTAKLDAVWDRLEQGKGAKRFVGELYYSQVVHFPGG